METARVETYAENCVGCLQCQMRCSIAFEGIINPLEARVKIQHPVTGKRGITFTEECNDCGLCVKVCLYGALKTKTRGDN